jgi:hypothetical protein
VPLQRAAPARSTRSAAPPIQPKAAAPPPRHPAPPVPPVPPAIQRKADEAPGAGGDFIVYEDRKSPGSPPPPPRWPVYALLCSEEGPCMLQDVKTGRLRQAGTVFGGFVRMARGGNVYISPRPAVGFPGDSHPTIAAGTPEGMRGKRALVAAGEIGIIDGRIVGHNDKTGHYQTRKNLYQSGLPPEKYHPFTEDPRDWYKKPR